MVSRRNEGEPPTVQARNQEWARHRSRKTQRRSRSWHTEQYPQTSWTQEVRCPLRYAIVIEKAENNYSAYVPDLPGCVATGSSIEETEAEIREAIEFHLKGMREDGLPIPAPQSKVEYIDITA